MSLIQTVTGLVRELEGATCDELAPYMPKSNRQQILKALNNAASAGHIECICRLPREGGHLAAGVYVITGSQPKPEPETRQTSRKRSKTMIRDNAIAILRILDERGAMTLRQLNDEHGEESRGHVIHLHRTHEMLDTQKTRGDVVFYSVSDKGRRYLAGLDKPAGQMPAPRTAVEFVPHKPKPWNPPREASNQHEKCNSVWNGEVTPYTPPRSNSGRALEPVGHGGLKFA